MCGKSKTYRWERDFAAFTMQRYLKLLQVNTYFRTEKYKSSLRKYMLVDNCCRFWPYTREKYFRNMVWIVIIRNFCRAPSSPFDRVINLVKDNVSIFEC